MGPGTRRASLFSLLAFAVVLTLLLAPAAEAKRVVGNNRANVLKGAGARDTLIGRGGDDVLMGFASADAIHGDEGDDVVLGEGGKDRLWGGGRDDTLDGGGGIDRIWPGWGADVVDAGPGNDLIDASENDAAMDSIDCGPGIDRVIVTGRSDKVFDCERVTRLRGRAVPGDFSHQAEATMGDDNLGVFNWYNRDFVDALAGNDYLNGHVNADMLWGNAGIDRLEGDTGPDRLLGGPDDDTVWVAKVSTGFGAAGALTFSRATAAARPPTTG